jgi:outer membrane protein
MLFGVIVKNVISEMKKIIWIMTLLMIPGFREISAQVKKWTLEDCVKYAVENNIGLQRQKLQTENAESEYLKSKMDILPSLNAGSDIQLGFGRSVDPVTSGITFNENISNQYYANSEIEIFRGLTKMNTISANKFMLRAGLETEKIVRNRLIGDILGQYYEVWYAKGIEEASKMQLDLSEKQLFRIKKMVETGREASSRQYEMESQVSSDRLSYTIARNTTLQAVTTLKQTLQLEPGTGFDILFPNLDQILITDDHFSPDSVYSLAAQILPRLKAIEYELTAAEKQVKAAKGAISPYLIGGGSINTGYYNVLSNGSLEQASFSEQMKNNNSQALYMSLRIPIFNRYSTARNIKLAKLRKNDTQLKLMQEKNNLYTDIENACLNFNRGKDEFSSASANLEFNKKSFNAVEKKFESGLVDVTDYSVASTKLFRAETETLRTKLQLMIRHILILFYSSGEYENLINL